MPRSIRPIVGQKKRTDGSRKGGRSLGRRKTHADSGSDYKTPLIASASRASDHVRLICLGEVGVTPVLPPKESTG